MTNSKPEGAGYIESSVTDRYNSMKVPSETPDLKHPDCTKITDQAATDQGYDRFQGGQKG